MSERREKGTPVWQSMPVYPAGHLHFPPVHVPLFSQVIPLHASVVDWQKWATGGLDCFYKFELSLII
jgi:hypothetical protein